MLSCSPKALSWPHCVTLGMCLFHLIGHTEGFKVSCHSWEQEEFVA